MAGNWKGRVAAKFEIRDSNDESNSKFEIRNGFLDGVSHLFRHSDFEFDWGPRHNSAGAPLFEFRISSFRALLVVFLLLIFASAGLASAEAIRRRGSGTCWRRRGRDHFWIARVARAPVDNSTGTSIVFRGKWSGDWTTLPIIPDRVVSIGTGNGELLLVLGNGQWEIADETDIRSGPTGSTWDTMLAIAGGQEAVWAIVRSSPASTVKSVGESAITGATNPSTEPATQPEAERRLAACQFKNGKWGKAQPIPDGVNGDPGQMSLVVVKGLPVLSWRTADGRLCVSEMSEGNGWSRAVTAAEKTGQTDFKLLTINDRAVLWLASAPAMNRTSGQLNSEGTSSGGTSSGGANEVGAGAVLIGDDFVRRIDLGMPTKLPANVGPRTLVAAFGNLRWIAYAGDQQIEQDYSLDEFPQSFPPAKLSVVPSPKPPVIPLTPWIGGDAVLLLLSGLAAVRQRNLPADSDDKKREGKPRLAPMGSAFRGGVGGSGADPGGSGDPASGERGQSAGEHRPEVAGRAGAIVDGDIRAAHAGGGARFAVRASGRWFSACG